MRTKILIAIIIGLLLTSCSSTKTLRFSQKENEILTTATLKEFLSEHKNPKVVLRVPNASTNLTAVEERSNLFNVIENQFLASGFVVRDRQLFSQILGNSENNIDYNSLKTKSDTELIIELSSLNPSVLYETNIYYIGKHKKIDKVNKYKEFGASIEFKVILIQNNEYAGLYKFNYTPCIDGCVLTLSVKDAKKQMKNISKVAEVPYEGVEKDVLENFVKNATKKLIDELRK